MTPRTRCFVEILLAIGLRGPLQPVLQNVSEVVPLLTLHTHLHHPGCLDDFRPRHHDCGGRIFSVHDGKIARLVVGKSNSLSHAMSLISLRIVGPSTSTVYSAFPDSRDKASDGPYR